MTPMMRRSHSSEPEKHKIEQGCAVPITRNKKVIDRDSRLQPRTTLDILGSDTS